MPDVRHDPIWQRLVVPIRPHVEAELFVPYPMTEADWKQFLAVLAAMKPGLVKSRGGTVTATPPDPLDLITWVQYRAAFVIASLALGEIALGDGTSDPVKVAADAMQAMRAEVRRFDDSEPSWEPPALLPGGGQ